MKPVAIVIAAAVALIPVAGLAEPRSDIAERVLDYLYPHRVKPAPIPLPIPRPVEHEPVPEAAPMVTPAPETQQQKEVMPHRPVPTEHDKTLPASADQERPARAKPKLGPRDVAKPKASKPPADVCSKIEWGLTIVSRERVIIEGMKRGHSRATVEKTIRDCGY